MGRLANLYFDQAGLSIRVWDSLTPAPLMTENRWFEFRGPLLLSESDVNVSECTLRQPNVILDFSLCWVFREEV